jgi:hypothetical protein
MKLPKALLIGAACLSLVAGSAKAADPSPVTSQAVGVVPVAAPGFSWAGPYIGVAGTYVTCPACSGAEIALRAGYDFTFGRFLAGANVEAFVATDGVIVVPGFEANGRFGAVLGERVLAYVQAGVGYFTGFGSTYFTAGGGVAVALGSRASIYGEVTPYWINPVSTVWRFSLGVDWHFGR